MSWLADTVHQPMALEELSALEAAGQSKLHGHVIWNAPRQTKQSATHGRNIMPHLGKPHLRVARCDNEVTRQAKFEPATDGKPLHRRYQRLARRTLEHAEAAA